MVEWERAKAWMDNYAHEDVNGEFTEREQAARRKLVEAARSMNSGEAP